MAMKREQETIICAADPASLEGVPREVKILPLGRVQSMKGTFEVDDESCRTIMAQFKGRHLDLVIDYEHQTLKDVQAPAGGWIKDIYKGDDALVAKVEWTPKAQEYLKNREYRYLSPVVTVRRKDRKAIGLHSVALTNTPAIDGMFAIVNSAGFPAGEIDDPQGGENMEFLKAFFGDKAITYDELVQAINAYNGDEKNKEKLIKMVNLTDGGYVSKDKYTNLETDLSGKTTELTKANNLIEELKKSAGKDEETQQKITAYETEIADLKKENAELKTENALKFALVAAGAVDVDYLVFKAKEKGEIKLGDDGKIKGEDDLISGLKTQHPTMFEASNGNQQQSGNRKILENNLPGGDKDKTVTKEQFLKMGYNERMKLKEENPELFKQLNVH